MTTGSSQRSQDNGSLSPTFPRSCRYGFVFSMTRNFLKPRAPDNRNANNYGENKCIDVLLFPAAAAYQRMDGQPFWLNMAHF